MPLLKTPGVDTRNAEFLGFGVACVVSKKEGVSVRPCWVRAEGVDAVEGCCAAWKKLGVVEVS